MGLALGLLGAAAIAWPALRDARWPRLIPDTALLAILPYVDADWPILELQERHGLGRAEDHYPGQYLSRHSRMWGWQWRLARAQCARLATSQAPARRRSFALSFILQNAPDPQRSTRVLSRCLEDSDDKIRWLAAWGIKATRYAYKGPDREQLTTALEALRHDGVVRVSEAADLALKAMAFPPADPEAADASLTPEDVQLVLTFADSATLATIYQRLGEDPRIFFWPYDGESGPFTVEALDLEVDGRAGTDRVLLISDRWQGNFGALIWLRRADSWAFAGAIHLGNNHAFKPQLFAVSRTGSDAWLVCRESAGSSGRGSPYLLVQDLWFRVGPGRIRLVADVWTQGHNHPDSVRAPARPVNWTFTSSPPRAVLHKGARAIEYDLDVAFATGRVDAWPASIAIGLDLFRAQATIRYVQGRDGSFKPDPATPWADHDAFGSSILGSPDDFLEAHAAELAAIALRGTPAQRSWLQLFLTTCTPAKVPATIQRDLAISNNADP